MIRKMTVLALISFMLAFTSTVFAQEKTTKAVQAEAQKTSLLTPEKFQEAAGEMVGEEVEIEGMVVHVCRHGGKKMFLIGEDSEIRIKITASDKVSAFKTELEGSTVYVKGIVEPMDEAEAMVKEEEHEEDDDHKNYYHRPQYSISCLAFKEVK